MKISTLLVSLFVSLVVCYVSVGAVALNNINYQDIAKNNISEDDRRGVPQSEVDSEHNKTKYDKFRRNAANSAAASATEKQQRYLQSAASSYEGHQSTGYSSGHGSDSSNPAKPDYYPSATGLGSLNPLPYSHASPPGDGGRKYHHHLLPLHHGTGGGISGYGNSAGGVGHTTGFGSGYGGDLGLGLGGHTYHYSGPSYGGAAKYPSYGLTKYTGEYEGHGGHGGLFGDGGHGGHGGHSSAHLKGLLLPLAGIALLGAAAALTANPVLLQLGVLNGKRKRRSVNGAAYQSVKRDLDKFRSIGKYIRRDS